MSKYIIDVGDAYTEYICGKGDMLCLPVRINEFEDNWLNTNIPLMPYTEHDFEQVRKEAYEQGRKDVETQFCSYDACKNRQEEYLRGLADAWEAARKIVCRISDGGYTQDLLDRIFGNRNYQSIMAQYSASDAVEKISKYGSEEQITKGDVVRLKSAPEVEIFVTYADEGYVGGIALTEVDDSCEIGDQYTDIRIHKVEKTGRHYEIAAVLAKMKEE